MDQVLEQRCLLLPCLVCTLSSLKSVSHWRGPYGTPAGPGHGTAGQQQGRRLCPPPLSSLLDTQQGISIREVDAVVYYEGWSGATVSLLEHPKLYYAILYYRRAVRPLRSALWTQSNADCLLDTSRGRGSRRGRISAVRVGSRMCLACE
jgi:hypothetical protein